MTPGPTCALAVTDTGVGMRRDVRAAHLRAVLHDQGDRQGHRARARDRLRHRHADRRLHLGRQRARAAARRSRSICRAATLAQSRPPVERRGGERPAPSRDGETVLVVEDEDACVRWLCTIARAARATRARGANARRGAAATFEASATRSTLAADRRRHAGGSGPDLHRRLSASRSPLPVLYMSGYTGHVTHDHRRLETGAPFLQKPFDADVLLRAVRRAMNG